MGGQPPADPLEEGGRRDLVAGAVHRPELDGPEGAADPDVAAAAAEVRQVLNQYVTYLMGRRPRLLPYLGS